MNENTTNLVFSEEENNVTSVKESLACSTIRKSQQGSNQFDSITNQVHHLLETRQLFLNPQCNSIQIAARLNLHPTTLSKAIKKNCGYGLPVLINVYRINYFKKLALSAAIKCRTIKALAEKSGFTNEATFYRQFSKLEGMSPKVFMATSNIKSGIA